MKISEKNGLNKYEKIIFLIKKKVQTNHKKKNYHNRKMVGNQESYILVYQSQYPGCDITTTNLQYLPTGVSSAKGAWGLSVLFYNCM